MTFSSNFAEFFIEQKERKLSLVFILLLSLILSSSFALFKAMDSKIAIVTGANKGIGFEIARKLATNGIKTILACRNPELGAKACNDLKVSGLSNVEFRQCDIGNSASVDEFVAALSKDYPKIDLLVNNAGIAFKGSDPTPFADQAEPTMRVNFFGTLYLTKSLLPLLKRSEAPVVVSVASMTGHLKILPSKERKLQFTDPNLSIDQLESLMNEFVLDVKTGVHSERGWPNSCYGMSKLGVIAMTKVLARDEPDVLITSCCPGYCVTDMTSRRGQLTAEEGARTPAFLAMLDPTDSSTFQQYTGTFCKLEKPVEW